MRKSDKEIDVVSGTDTERGKYIDKCIDYLLGSLDSVQWVSLAHICNELAPISLQDKEQLLKSLVIFPRKKMESKTYIEWLDKQKDRKDNLGYLVRKFLTDKNIRSWYGFLEHLEILGATEDEIKICEHSWVEYTTQRCIDNMNIRIEVISGDITMVDSDAIITAINSKKLWFGGIDGAIQRVSGDIYHKQAANEELMDLDVIVARGSCNDHKGKFDNVVFVVDDLKSELRNIIAKGLEEADVAGFKKVTIPAIRTGVMLGVVETSLDQVVYEYMNGIREYLSRRTTKGQIPGIQTIVFVTYNNPKLEEILFVIRKMERRH